MEVAPGGAGDQQVSRRGLNIGLYVLALVLACACVFGGVLVVQEHRDRQRAEAVQERYGDVLEAARAEMKAFLSFDYQDPQASIDAVTERATDKFAKEYAAGTEGMLTDLEEAKSVMDGDVVWAGVVDADADSATVIVATSGTVSNNLTENKPVARDFRVKLDLVREDGEWLADGLEFVG